MDDRGSNPGSLQFHLQVRHHGDQSGFGRPVCAHVRALPQCDIGADEDHISPLPFDHPGQHRGGESVRADEVDLNLRLEGIGVGLVDPRIGGAIRGIGGPIG